jgi:sugar lactone lactonase YvrE
MPLARVIALCSCSLLLLAGCDLPAPTDPPPPDEPAAGSAGTAGASPAGTGGTSERAGPGGMGGTAGITPVDASLADADADEDAHTDEDAGALDEQDAAPPLDPDTCPDGFPRGVPSTTTRKLATLDPSPEGVGACANGDVFAGAAEKLWRIPLDGAPPELFATLPGRALEGIVCDDRGRIFVADISALAAVLTGAQPALPPAVLMLEGDGSGSAVPLVLEDPPVQLTGYNGLLWVPGRGIYTTDMGAGLVVRFEEVAPSDFVGSVVQDELPGANGLAYDPRLQTLYVVLTGMLNETGIADSSVESFPVLEDGTLGARTTLWTSPNWLDGADGLAIDEHGVLYRANQLSGTVSRMSDEEVVAKVPNPASLAFRGGTLLISDFKMLGPLQGPGGVYAVDLGVCGGPLW